MVIPSYYHVFLSVQVLKYWSLTNPIKPSKSRERSAQHLTRQRTLIHYPSHFVVSTLTTVVQ